MGQVLEHLGEFAIFTYFLKSYNMSATYEAGSQSQGNGRVLPGPETLEGTKDLLAVEEPWLGLVEEEEE